MPNLTQRPVENEPLGFSAAWDALTTGKKKDFGGPKQAYAEFFRAGQESLKNPIVAERLGITIILGPRTKL